MSVSLEIVGRFSVEEALIIINNKNANIKIIDVIIIVELVIFLYNENFRKGGTLPGNTGEKVVEFSGKLNLTMNRLAHFLLMIRTSMLSPIKKSFKSH